MCTSQEGILSLGMRNYSTFDLFLLHGVTVRNVIIEINLMFYIYYSQANMNLHDIATLICIAIQNISIQTYIHMFSGCCCCMYDSHLQLKKSFMADFQKSKISRFNCFKKDIKITDFISINIFN